MSAVASATEFDTPPRRRADLVVNEQRFQGQTSFFLKDPLTLQYYRFAAPEFQFFNHLDGHRTYRELLKEMTDAGQSDDVSIHELSQLVKRWQRIGLLETSDPKAATQMFLGQQRLKSRSAVLQGVSRILYLKFHAFDPETLLNRAYPAVRWMFHPLGLGIALCLMMSAMFLVLSRFDQFIGRPEIQNFRTFFNLQNVGWLWLTIGMVKILHEFGHAFTCKHFGGECHGMGLLFMCFTPCLYCDVSDSWMLPNKWHRIAIAAAGVYVELLTASVATFVWWLTQPGIVHSIAFSAMLYGSVQTILINANPLMKFDGYFAMSDFLEVPNLRQKSYAALKFYMSKWCWGTNLASPGLQGVRGLLFTVYAIAATVYGWMVTVLMLWFLTTFLQPYKLTIVSRGLAVMAVVSMFGVPAVMTIAAAVKTRSRWRPASWWRPGLTVICVCALLVAVSVIPVPRRVYGVLTIEPVRCQQVAVTDTGQISKIHIRSGQAVKKDDLLIELENASLRFGLDKLEQDRDVAAAQLTAAQASLNPARAYSLQFLLAELDAQIELQQRRLSNLQVRAPCSGIVIPEPEIRSVSPPSTHQLSKLGRGAGTAFDQRNVGAVLAGGTPICRIRESSEFEAIAILPQDHIEFVQAGQRGTIKLDALTSDTLTATVREVGVLEVSVPPVQLLTSSGSELPGKIQHRGITELATPHYQVRLQFSGAGNNPINAESPLLRVGQRGRVWIQTGSQPLAWMWWRWICGVLKA